MTEDTDSPADRPVDLPIMCPGISPGMYAIRLDRCCRSLCVKPVWQNTSWCSEHLEELRG